MQPEIETEGILDEGTKREQRDMDSVRVYAGVYAMRGCMCRQVGAMQVSVHYAMCAMWDGQAGRSAYADMRERANMCYVIRCMK